MIKVEMELIILHTIKKTFMPGLLMWAFIGAAGFAIMSAGPVMAEDVPWPWVDSANGVSDVTILLMGDTNIQYRTDPNEAYRYVLPTLREADIRFANLEGPFAGSSKDPMVSDIPHKRWTHSEPDQVETLVAAGIDAVGVANNVTYPWQALMRSLEVLDRAGIKYAGGGKNLKEAHKPVIIERKNTKIGFLQYAATVFPFNHAATEERPGIAEIKVYTAYQPPKNLDKPGQPPYVITWLDDASRALMVEDVRRLKEQADIAIVSFHWGVSGTSTIISFQADIAHAVIDAGADVVFGHGPHKFQKVEVYRGKPILYSVAQFLFDDPTRKDRMLEGLLTRVLVRDKKLAAVSLLPTWRVDAGLTIHLYDPNIGKGRELFGYLKSVNEGGAELVIRGNEIVIEGVGK